MSETRVKIIKAIESYFENEEKFSTKGNDAAGKRARADLHEIGTLAKIRRSEIQEARNAKKAEK